MSNYILDKIKQALANNPYNCAIHIDGSEHSYMDFYNDSSELANALSNIGLSKPRCAIFTKRSIYAYHTILACTICGGCYIPLNYNFPLDKNIQMIEVSDPDIICIDIKDLEQIIKIIESTSAHIMLFSDEHLFSLRSMFPKRLIIYWRDATFDKATTHTNSTSQHDIAYIMFTSGSTGMPKSVAVTYGNLSSYISSIIETYKFNSHDRLCQFSELTFDLSVHEIFTSWCSGAALYVFPQDFLFGIKKFIQKNKITAWISVPSIVSLFKKMAILDKDCFPSLRISLFCGEPLLYLQALDWKVASPNSFITNLYGPTEATVAFTHYDMKEGSFEENINIVPIGIPFPNQHCAIVDENNNLCLDLEVGELCLSGSQVVSGYHNAPIENKKRFLFFDWDDNKSIWYKTGDFAYRNAQGIYHFVGRVDDQWQIRGHRVEKNEIEKSIRTLVEHDLVAVVPISHNTYQHDGICAFIVGDFNSDELYTKMRKAMPDVIVPKKLIKLEKIPKNSNGKVDYYALKKKMSMSKNEVNPEVTIYE